MKLSEMNTTIAAELGILPAYSRAQKLLKLKAEIEAVPFDRPTAEEAQRVFTLESEDAHEGLGQAWDHVVLAIAYGWDIPCHAITALAERIRKNAQNSPRIFA